MLLENEMKLALSLQELRASDSVLSFTLSTENRLDMFVLNLCPRKNFGGGHGRRVADLGPDWRDTSGPPGIVGKPRRP